MSNFQRKCEFYNHPLHLTDDERSDPLRVLADFFIDYRLGELRDFAAQIQEVCLTTDATPFDEPEKRADLILYHKKLELLLEAAFVMAQAGEGD